MESYGNCLRRHAPQSAWKVRAPSRSELSPAVHARTAEARLDGAISTAPIDDAEAEYDAPGASPLPAHGDAISVALSVFVSSACYELRDLRFAIRDLLNEYGIVAIMSENPGFAHESGVKPYVTCVSSIANCPLVIGVLENEYGSRFDDWGAYPQYNGLSPTHAEFRHALATGKKLNVYVHRDTMTAYQTWCADRNGFAALTRTHGPKIETLQLLHELKTRDVPPWIVAFGNASDVVTSLRSNLVNEIFESLKDQRATQHRRHRLPHATTSRARAGRTRGDTAEDQSTASRGHRAVEGGARAVAVRG